MYRLMLDLPLGTDFDHAKATTEDVMGRIRMALESANYTSEDITVIQYRLSNDFDRGNKNYLDINENGHCSNKKCKIVINGSDETIEADEQK